jgi:pyruvate/2-oxoglutarate dehydrogenase complex dihydrolipoamide acyltransferase (E2) component
MKLRSDYKDEFVTKHGVKLGLMSCFVKVLSLMCCKAFEPYIYMAG